MLSYLIRLNNFLIEKMIKLESVYKCTGIIVCKYCLKKGYILSPKNLPVLNLPVFLILQNQTK